MTFFDLISRERPPGRRDAARCAPTLAFMMLLCLALPARAQQTDESFISGLLEKMTLEEKLGQLTQYSGRWATTGPDVPQGGDAEVRAGRVGSFLNIFGAEAVCRVQKMAVEESRLGIPLLFGHDVIHGFRTLFPIPLGQAASFNPAGVEHAARIAAREATAVGLAWTFAPMVDVSRDPRWGRIAESSGEDPYLNSVFAAANVRGFQGDDLASDSTLVACAKHFAAYGGAEAGRDYNTVDVSERTLREVYLPPFRAAVDAGAQTFMAAFNEVGGVPATASHFLMTDVLRGEWGFDGFVVSDYTGVWELLFHGTARDSTEAARKALAAGVDMEMVSGMYVKKLAAEVEAGRLPVHVVDEAVRRVLRVKTRAGLFEDPYRYCRDTTRAAATLLAPTHRQAARAAARESIVLLKNERETLPFSKNLGAIAVIGALAADSVAAMGTWAAAGRPAETTSVLRGIREALSGTRVLYAPGYAPIPPRFEDAVAASHSADTTGFALALQHARQADAVVLVLGEHRELSGEAASRTDIGLPGVQLALAYRILALGKPVAVVLMNGRPLALPELDRAAPALLEAWHLGSEMGHAVADVLFGDYNPGGKLPVTFPRSVGQIPIYYNHKMTGRPIEGNMKYRSRYVDSPNTPLYPFGHGLSYTTFQLSNLRLSSAQLASDGTLTVAVDVTNTGRRAGDEVVQLYVRDDVRSTTPPVRELKGFRRITLQPGQAQTISFVLTPQDLQFWGMDEEWTTEAGTFTIFVGNSSVGGLEGRFEIIE